MSAAHPSVSVVIPVYNRPKAVIRAVRSVLTQSMSDLEVIVVDDGSTDETVQAVAQLAADEPRLRLVLLGQNSGLPARARNRGIAEARGKYVAFLDSDDVWSPRKLERQVAVLEARSDIALVHSYLWEVSPTCPLRGLVYVPDPRRRMVDANVLQFRNPIQCSSVVLRKSVLDGVGGFDEDPQLRSIEDFELWRRVALTHRLAYLSEIHGRYLAAPSGLSSQEDWSVRHQYLDARFGTATADARTPRGQQVLRRVTSGLQAYYHHMLEAPVRQVFGRGPRVWSDGD